jgi:indolepyruvate ferredoxin oxidoreductase alpha subunit
MYVLHSLGFRTADGPVGKGDFVVTSDIGCYTLGVNPPLSALDTCACMGASIGQAIGLVKSGIPNRVVAVIGDSTFMHSGITGLVDAVYNQAGITVVILDNETTAMTGHQGHPGTGISPRGQETRSVRLEDVCRGVGVTDVSIIDAFDLAGIETSIKKATESTEPSVVIVRGSCVLAVRTKRAAFTVDPDTCISCYTCLDIGCPSISFDDDVATISDSCVGCGICAQVCPQGAISEMQQ